MLGKSSFVDSSLVYLGRYIRNNGPQSPLRPSRIHSANRTLQDRDASEMHFLQLAKGITSCTTTPSVRSEIPFVKHRISVGISFSVLPQHLSVFSTMRVRKTADRCPYFAGNFQNRGRQKRSHTTPWVGSKRKFSRIYSSAVYIG